MKRNDIKQLATKDTSELLKQLEVINMELAKAKLAKVAGKLANVRSISTLRDDVARIKTVLHNQQVAAPVVAAKISEK